MGSSLKSLNVLVTGAGAPGFPGIVKALMMNKERKIKIVATDAKEDVVGYYLVKKHYKVPIGNDPTYVESILKIGRKEKIDVILPLCTLELLPLAENREKFEKIGIKVVVSEPEALEVALNKGKLFDFFKDSYAPKFFKVTTVEEFEKSCERLGYPEKPIVFKPVMSFGSRGLRIIIPNLDRSSLFFKEKPTSVYTSYEDMLNILSQKPFPESLVMEYLPGKEYSVDLLIGDDVIYSIPRERVVIKQGISNVGRIEKNEELIEVSSYIAKKLGLKYNVNMQFKQDEKGELKIIEINPRVSGSIIFCVGAGVNLPYYGIKLVLGEDVPKVPVKWGLRVYRHWEEVFVSNGRIFKL